MRDAAAGRVAPYTGAWIEILHHIKNETAYAVAPYTGAWIEISRLMRRSLCCWSLPTRERGLKFPQQPI